MTKKTLIWISVLFVGLCLWQITSAVLSTDGHACPSCILLQQGMTQDAPVVEANAVTPVATPVLAVDTSIQFGATGGAPDTVFLGSTGKESGYEYELELDSRGAAVKTARFSQHDNRNPKDPQPLSILTPTPRNGGDDVLSLANSYFYLPNHGQQLNLGRLHWQISAPVQGLQGEQTAELTATITHADNQPAFRLTKTYTVRPGTFMMDCSLKVDNLMSSAENAYFSLYGPCGLDKEDSRMDMRKVIAAYRNSQGQITSTRIDTKGLTKAIKKGDTLSPTLPSKPSGTPLLWVGAMNKYFAGLIIPVDEAGQVDSSWIQSQRAMLFDADGNPKSNDDQNIGLVLQSKSFTLAAAEEPGSSQTFHTQIYLGPKDKEMFDKHALYHQLGFKETIDFMSCCCPASIINPLAFAILKLMNMIFSITGNYGIAIIILVALMRLLLHPVTKKSQISMHKMSKLAPRAEEIKKKYANNKAEMQKQLMELYREQGASPITGMLPMFIQMPVWIALWSAVNSSINLRGAELFPVWITDLSSPDRLFPFFGFNIPFLGEYFNLLPILMGVAFYMQQKLMPTQASASSNPQVAQQQKMMMVMMPVLFPVMFYNVASGVNLYIMTSTFAGVIEQKIIRKHIKEREDQEGKGLVSTTSKAGGKVKKKKPKPMFKQF